jgi:hypothetical protein
MKKVLISGWLALFALPVFGQQYFATPEKAATALADAVSTQNETALNDLLGRTGVSTCRSERQIRKPSPVFFATGKSAIRLSSRGIWHTST